MDQLGVRAMKDEIRRVYFVSGCDTPVASDIDGSAGWDIGWLMARGTRRHI